MRPPVRGRPRGERGLSESVQWALITPVLLLLLLGGIQIGVVLHGRHAAGAAAQAAAEAAAAFEAPIDAGRDAALPVARTAGLRDVDVGVIRAGGRVDVVVDARVPIFFDVGQGHVQARASRPVERVTTPGGTT